MTPRKPESHGKAANGTPLHLRHVAADDGERLRRSLDKLSPEARRQRFLGAVNSISDAFVRDLTDAPRERQCTLLVVRREAGEEIPVAGGRFVIGDTPETADTCEFALTIGDAWQGQGIGRRLVEAFEEWALSRGARHVSLTSAMHREQAHGFYRACGWEATGLRFARDLG